MGVSSLCKNRNQLTYIAMFPVLLNDVHSVPGVRYALNGHDDCDNCQKWTQAPRGGQRNMFFRSATRNSTALFS